MLVRETIKLTVFPRPAVIRCSDDIFITQVKHYGFHVSSIFLFRAMADFVPQDMALFCHYMHGKKFILCKFLKEKKKESQLISPDNADITC